MCGEACTAQSHDPCLFHDIPDLISGQLRRVTVCSHSLYGFILSIVLHDYGIHHASVCHTAGLHSLDRTGHGTDDISGYEASGLCDLLSCQNLVALFHQRLCRRADMLRNRINQLPLRHQDFNRLIFGQFFSLIWMNAAFKCSQSHLTNPLSIHFRYHCRKLPPPASYQVYHKSGCSTITTAKN